MNVLHTEMQGYYSKCNLIQEKGGGGGGRGGGEGGGGGVRKKV